MFPSLVSLDKGLTVSFIIGAYVSLLCYSVIIIINNIIIIDIIIHIINIIINNELAPLAPQIFDANTLTTCYLFVATNFFRGGTCWRCLA